MTQKCSICRKVDEFSGKSEKCIFHCEKDDWYEEKDGEKEWNDVLVKRFWKEIRVEKMAYNSYFFESFIFPKFEEKWGVRERKRAKKQLFINF